MVELEYHDLLQMTTTSNTLLTALLFNIKGLGITLLDNVYNHSQWLAYQLIVFPSI